MHSLLMDMNGLIYLPVDKTILENPFRYKFVPCQHFLQGSCKKSDAACQFSHGSMLPLPTYSQPQGYWYNVSLDPSTCKWVLESIPDNGCKQPPAVDMATGLPLINRKPQQLPWPYDYPYTGYPGAGVMGAKPVGFPPMGRQGAQTSAYKGRAKYRNSPAAHSQQSSGQRWGKKQLAKRQANYSSQAKSVDMTSANASLVQALDSMSINGPDSDASSVSSWASRPSKVSTSKSIPVFSRSNFPGLPGSNNEDGSSHGAGLDQQSSEMKPNEVTTQPQGAWALGGPQQRLSLKKLAADSSETKLSETKAAEKQN